MPYSVYPSSEWGEVELAITGTELASGAIRTAKVVVWVPPSIDITTEKASISAGGKNNQTDVTRLIVELKDSKKGFPAKLRMENGLGIGDEKGQPIEIGGSQYIIGINVPAMLKGAFNLTAGSQPLAVFVKPGKNQCSLFSSNKIDDDTRVFLEGDGHGTGDDSWKSPRIVFSRPSFSIAVSRSDDGRVVNDQLVAGVDYLVNAHCSHDGIPVSGHRSLLVCRSVTPRSGPVILLDQNSDNNISIDEVSRLGNFLRLNVVRPINLSASGDVRRSFKVNFLGLQSATFFVIDLDVASAD